MALGTLDRTPPPFFRQGPSSLTKLSFCSALAVFLMVAGGREYLGGLARAIEAEQAARSELARQSERAQRADQLEHENTRLRALLELRPTLSVRSQAAEILYEAADPYSRKVIIDRGVTHNVLPGSPVINEAGVLGQVTRVYLQSAEV